MSQPTSKPIFGIPAIAEGVYGDGSPYNQRRVRHLIGKHDFPVLQRGRIIWTFPEWIEAYLHGETVKVGRG